MFIRFFGNVFLIPEEDENRISDEIIEVGLEESLGSDYAEGLSAQVLTLEPLAKEIKGQQIDSRAKVIIKEFKEILFQDKRNAKRMNLINCELWAKTDVPV